MDHRETRRPRFGRAEIVLGVAVCGTLVLGAALAHEPRSIGDAPRATLLTRLSPRGVPEASDAQTRLLHARASLAARREDGDERHLGHAEAALLPLLEHTSPDVRREARLLHAVVLQARHAFAQALAELDGLIAEQPSAQSLLTRASVSLVMGDPQAALVSCASLVPLASESVASGCRAPALAASGKLDEALDALARALATSRDRETRAWLRSVEGELRYWYGGATDLPRAERALRDSLALDRSDRYTRALLADLLLDRQRTDEARALCAGSTDDALLLRAALATDGPARTRTLRALEQRLVEGAQRGGASHERERARLALALGEPARALALARAGFAAQREPWDIRLYIEAAQALGDERAAESARSHLKQIGTESLRMRADARGTP